MKKTIHIFSFLLFSAIGHAQGLNMELEGATDSRTQPIVLAKTEHYGIIRVVDTLEIKDNKTFNYQVKLTEPTVGSLFIGDKMFNVWLEPGSILKIILKGGKPEFSGKAGVYASYYVEDQYLFKQMHTEYKKKYPSFDTGNNLFSNRYFEILDSITIERLNFLNSYFKSDSREQQQFIDFQTNSLIYSSLYYKLAYEGSDIERFKFYQAKSNLKREDFYIFSEQVVLQDTLLMSNLYYNNFVTQLIADIAFKRQKSGGGKFAIEPYVDFAMLTVDELTEGAHTAPKFKALLLNKIVEEIEQESKREWMPKVKSTIIDLTTKYGDKSIALVKAKLDKVAENIRFTKGEPAPSFFLKDIKGKSYNLQDFRGKKVYMDLGASWCKPCIEGIPAWNELVEEYSKNKDVVFISLSLDDREEQWQRWVKKYHPKGLLLYAGEGGFKSKFAKDFNVKAIPRFVLLDEEGKIDAFYAPEPKDIQERLLPRK